MRSKKQASSRRRRLTLQQNLDRIERGQDESVRGRDGASEGRAHPQTPSDTAQQSGKGTFEWIPTSGAQPQSKQSCALLDPDLAPALRADGAFDRLA